MLNEHTRTIDPIAVRRRNRSRIPSQKYRTPRCHFHRSRRPWFRPHPSSSWLTSLIHPARTWREFSSCPRPVRIAPPCMQELFFMFAPPPFGPHLLFYSTPRCDLQSRLFYTAKVFRAFTPGANLEGSTIQILDRRIVISLAVFVIKMGSVSRNVSQTTGLFKSDDIPASLNQPPIVVGLEMLPDCVPLDYRRPRSCKSRKS